MYVQKAIYLLPILIISISFICAVVLAIVFCLKKKAKYLFIVASAFIIVSVLSCIAIKFTPPAKAPENEVYGIEPSHSGKSALHQRLF